ncbi:hypothetical protein K4L44_09280 [Halosquirtibacter laminarini]|uniref:Uncharacterized protein n=1 Tax=Halosquirtibacter laminarini TaxID=3374600 RepID=A0AC61NF34_9BACT|nr:hypothetical protein K4L44_09280 [Prolixibacteraceae bacterium]
MKIEVKGNEFYIGINWGAIKELGWFKSTYAIPVDLDILCFEVNNKRQLEVITNLEKKETTWAELSQDDMSGDMNGDDKLDNEWITFYTKRIHEGSRFYVGVINYTEQSLIKVSHFDYRIYNGAPNKDDEIFYKKDILKEVALDHDSESIILGYLTKESGKVYYIPIESPSQCKMKENMFEEIKEKLFY